MQTHEWEALLDGTTPGPWEVAGCHTTWARTGPDSLLPELSRRLTVTLTTPAEGTNLAATKEDARLAAHAPAAVAEVIRLRKAIAELEAEERATAEDEFFPVHLRDLCRAYADDLYRILEGDTDE